ncbi:hypothetical protein EYF80_025306 [Liparis tanakae]|uniref:Uncharacterized protein n=1 Tax=Liparis tanakae TaxID=230148 RepID=A0A4Z2HGS7_9TELE|nr:hypothetical protein EYF80_025306 [Liparis tanakae]
MVLHPVSDALDPPLPSPSSTPRPADQNSFVQVFFVSRLPAMLVRVQLRVLASGDGPLEGKDLLLGVWTNSPSKGEAASSTTLTWDTKGSKRDTGTSTLFLKKRDTNMKEVRYALEAYDALWHRGVIVIGGWKPFGHGRVEKDKAVPQPLCLAELGGLVSPPGGGYRRAHEWKVHMQDMVTLAFK